MLRTKLRLALALGLSLCFAPTGTVAQELVFGDPSDLLVLDKEYVSGLSEPTALEFLPDGTLVITEKGGTVKLRSPDGDVTEAGSFSVDSRSEKGLLNVLSHPDFEKNRLLFFYYSASDDAGGSNEDRHRVVTVRLGTNRRLDFDTETTLVRGLRGPANHDGGALAFDQSKTHLFIGVGDTGCNSGAAPSAGKISNYFGTCLTNGNGKILRVTLDGDIPTNNPLVGESAVTACGSSCGTAPTTTGEPREDIWAWGFRNPWRMWTDPVTGKLWVGDVGEVTYEEINVVDPEGGRHFGWPFREGKEGAPRSRCTEIEPDAGDCVDPVYVCSHDENAPVDGDCASITGGFIIDDCSWPESFRERYLFGDYSRHHVFTVKVNSNRDGVVPGSREPLVERAGSPVHFTLGPDGAVYYANVGAGTIVRIAPKDRHECPNKPEPGAGGNAGEGPDSSGGDNAGGHSSGGKGTAGKGGKGSGGASSSSAGKGGSETSNDQDDDGGCGCRIMRSERTGFALSLSALALVALALRRRGLGSRRGR